ncbi:uncharacterized protein SETTUDRAFT_29709 [Exserohilum turcica Et28A]|uniref:Uncharacterized protein n=1 Tax=Exserohilum turcicum (strain 28A) TaxID=671987 RepID=R0IGM7_EXST2|nr:uncharacterized protein SETTUDRAFT_29709 [Exserohilum turcica Et28A]EOA84410.1 hypothetical protein SETTUDRAFT_29709 [Exserohilum turcica Et28A]
MASSLGCAPFPRGYFANSTTSPPPHPGADNTTNHLSIDPPPNHLEYCTHSSGVADGSCAQSRWLTQPWHTK